MHAMLAMLIAVAAVPVFYGVIPSDARCSLTLDICHPAQSASSSPAPIIAPPPQTAPSASALSPLDESLDAFESATASRPADAPDPPPPKRAA
jgi:hypothetical protein